MFFKFSPYCRSREKKERREERHEDRHRKDDRHRHGTDKQRHEEGRNRKAEVHQMKAEALKPEVEPEVPKEGVNLGLSGALTEVLILNSCIIREFYQGKFLCNFA